MWSILLLGKNKSIIYSAGDICCTNVWRIKSPGSPILIWFTFWCILTLNTLDVFNKVCLFLRHDLSWITVADSAFLLTLLIRDWTVKLFSPSIMLVWCRICLLKCKSQVKPQRTGFPWLSVQMGWYLQVHWSSLAVLLIWFSLPYAGVVWPQWVRCCSKCVFSVLEGREREWHIKVFSPPPPVEAFVLHKALRTVLSLLWTERAFSSDACSFEYDMCTWKAWTKNCVELPRLYQSVKNGCSSVFIWQPHQPATLDFPWNWSFHFCFNLIMYLCGRAA